MGASHLPVLKSFYFRFIWGLTLFFLLIGCHEISFNFLVTILLFCIIYCVNFKGW